MPPRRPAPLSDDLLDGSAGAVLLGRTRQLANAAPLKKQGDVADWSPTTKDGAFDSDLSPRSAALMGAATLQSTRSVAHHWAFTPIATPSPSARAAALQQLLALGVSPTATQSPSQVAAAPSMAEAMPGPVATAAPLLLPVPTVSSMPLSAQTLATTPERQLPLQKVAAAAAASATPATTAHSPPAEPSPHRWSSETDDSEESESEEECRQQQQRPSQATREVPQRPPGARYPSIGSAGHDVGHCKRCCFFPRGRCMNGYACEFCHCEHEKRKRRNKNKGKKLMPTPPPRSAPKHPQLAPSLSARAAVFVPRSQPSAPVAPMEQTPSFSYCTLGEATPQQQYYMQCGPSYATAGPMYSSPAPQCIAQPVMQAACYTCEGVPLASSPMTMGAERPGVYQLADGSCCMMTGTSSGMAQFCQTGASQPEQHGSHVVMLEPAVMSSAAQSASQADPPSAPPVASPRLSQADASPPPPPNGSPRMGLQASAVAA